MAEYFGNLPVPEADVAVLRWVNPSQIDMETAHTFQAANRQIVGSVFGTLLTPQAEILELGCGLGHLAQLVPPEYHANYTQTDQNPRYVEISAAVNPGVWSAVADVYELTAMPVSHAKGESFDAVVAMEVLDILEDLPAAAAGIAHVLRSGGVFVHFHNRRPCMATLARKAGEEGYVFPRLDADGALRRLQVVPERAYAAARSSLAQPEACDIVARRPDLLALKERVLFDDVAKDIAATLGPAAHETATFVSMMHRLAESALKESGLTVHIADASSTGVQASRTDGATIFNRLGGPEINVLTKEADGPMYYARATLPDGQAWYQNALSVLAAGKPAE